MIGWTEALNSKKLKSSCNKIYKSREDSVLKITLIPIKNICPVKADLFHAPHDGGSLWDAATRGNHWMLVFDMDDSPILIIVVTNKSYQSSIRSVRCSPFWFWEWIHQWHQQRHLLLPAAVSLIAVNTHLHQLPSFNLFQPPQLPSMPWTTPITMSITRSSSCFSTREPFYLPAVAKSLERERFDVPVIKREEEAETSTEQISNLK